ncbi:MAG: putative reverse transcriptase [Streblomastix strix]|uniref:Putative reverse transcriptase n=1 Tax=Streblomastix strix TaxID=222440 RepID=A0A5J4WG00_9EUKA|nr:MAG: putative reverse transcriptase [Streblomastix strix]
MKLDIQFEGGYEERAFAIDPNIYFVAPPIPSTILLLPIPISQTFGIDKEKERNQVKFNEKQDNEEQSEIKPVTDVLKLSYGSVTDNEPTQLMQTATVNQSDNDSSEHADNENDNIVRARAQIPFDDFIDAMDGSSDDDDDYSASPVPQSTDDNSLDVLQTSGDEEVRNANLEPLRRIRAELDGDSDDETSTESEEHDLPGIQRKRLLEDELEIEAENSESDSLIPQDPDALEVLNKINQKAKDYDPLVPEIDEDYIKALRERSRVDQSPLKIAMPPKIVEGEKTPQYGNLIRNVVAAQSTNVLAAEAIFQKGKLEAAERILDTFELIGQATVTYNLYLINKNISIDKIQKSLLIQFTSSLVPDGIGARLQRYQAAWKKINANKILEDGAPANWIHPNAPNLLLQNRQYSEFQGTIQEKMIYQYALEVEIKQGIVKKIKKDEALFFNRTFIIPRKDKRLRKILDCRQINKFLKEESFKSEDIKTVTQLSLIKDWVTVIDIHNAYNHIQIAKKLQQFLAFAFNHQIYTYIGMPFGLKTAPFIFHKHLHPAIQIIRKEDVRVVVYFDNILILCQDPTLLHQQTNKVIQILENLGWIISPKSVLIPMQEIKYLEWLWNFKDLTIRMIEERRRNMINKLLKWNRRSNRGQIVHTRELAKIIGKLVFLKTQFPRILLHMKLLYKTLTHATSQQGWSGYLKLNPKLRRDWSWSLSLIKKNTPQHFQVIPPQVILTTVASKRGWGAKFQKINQSTEIKKNFSRTLSHLTDQTLQLAECLQIQLNATYIPGIENQTADSLSRLNRAGDYHLNMRIAEQVFKTMQFFTTIDLFANRKTMLTKRYCTINLDHFAVARDAFSKSWKAEQPVIHPPIHLIGHCLQRIKQEKIAAIMIVPNWEGQYWWPLIQQMTTKQINLVQSSQILKNGPIATRRGWALPPGELLAILVSDEHKEDEEKNCIDKQ